MSRVSIITPAYNAEQYIADTINSVQAQTFTDWEMIIVDDCSSDNTYNLACKYAVKDARIKVKHHQQNCGVAAARNTALDAARGDYIAFIDSDDQWVPEKLSKQLAFMKENQFALTYTAYQNFDTNTGNLGKIIWVPKKMTYSRIFINTSIACLTVIVNRKMVGEFHMPQLSHTEDQCTWQDILNRGYTAHGLNENLALYRTGNKSLTYNKLRAAKMQWNTYREYYKLPVIKSSFYFTCYTINALKKHLL